MAWNDAVITNIGMNMLVQAAGGTALNICTAKCGGTAVDVAALILQTDVSDPKKIIQITGFEINGNKIKVSVRIINSGITSTYTVRQIGLYAKQTGSETEKLLAIIQDNTGELIPTETENPNFQIDFAFSIAISNTDNITVTVNPEAYITVEEFKSHAENKNNPHGVTKSQIGLGNVPNVMTNDQTPTYTIESENKDLSSGEKLSIAFGKIAKAISSFFKHIADNVSHITSSEREIWNNSQEKLYITGSGNPVVIDNLQGGVPFPEIVVSGKNLIPYPYNRTSGVYNGLTVDISDDGKFSVNGTATADTIIFEFEKQSNPIYLSGGVSYTLNCSQQYNIDSFNIFFKVYHADKTYSGYTKYPASFTAKNGDYLVGSLWIKSGSVVNAENVEIQLELGNTPTEYEPPITGRELTLNINGTEIAVTPDSNPYTVPDDIRQQDGLNVLTVSAGKLTVIGNTINPQLKKTVDMIDDNATKLYSLDSSGNPYIGEDKENNKVYVQWDGVKYLKLSSRFNKTAADYAASAGIVGVVSYPSSGTTGDVVLGFKPSCVIAVSQSFTNSTAGQKTFAVMITGSIAQTLYHPDGSVIISLTDTGFTANFNSGTVNMFRYIAFK